MRHTAPTASIKTTNVAVICAGLLIALITGTIGSVERWPLRRFSRRDRETRFDRTPRKSASSMGVQPFAIRASTSHANIER